MIDNADGFHISKDFDMLRRQYEQLYTENMHLKRLLVENGISYKESADPLQAIPVKAPQETSAGYPIIDTQSINPGITKKSSLDERIKLYLSLFRGRRDVYACQWQSKEGKMGYSPACRYEWVQGICGKPRVKCSNCANAAYLPFDDKAVALQLSGNKVLGVYPLLPDGTCEFLAVDFDEASWKTDIHAIALTCTRHKIPYAVEISRSGNGAHFWLFFSEPIEAPVARGLGSQLLTQSMRENARLAFSSYDRMFPNQDTVPKGGFGNLIALPFQKEAYKNGGSIFVDSAFIPYPDQWMYISTIQRISRAQIDAWMIRERTATLGKLRQNDDEEGKPWLPANTEKLTADDFPNLMRCVEADRLYIPLEGMSQKAQNCIKRLAAFDNPQFYRAQAMRMPVWSKPRVICCAKYEENYLCLPRGCKEDFCTLAAQSSAGLKWEDLRGAGKVIDVCFTGVLHDEQKLALDALTKQDNGVLSAATAFGKTVVGAALIGEKKVSTLILVHRRQLMQQWMERLAYFLDINETLPEAPRQRGRKKRRESIGEFGGGRDTRGGVIDIAIIQSMGSKDNIKPWIADYGMIIVDECHHIPAVSFEQVLRKVRARYVYGLTATPTRQDGHHPILNMYLGAIRYRVDAKVQAEKRPFAHMMIPRFTGARFHISGEERTPLIGQYYAQIMEDDLRNHQIADDVLSCVREGRNCLVLSERTLHVKLLAQLLEKQYDKVLTLTGGSTNAQTARQLSALRDIPPNKPLIICATGKYIGEGFDEPRLDTLFLTMPISWHGTLAQYAGRLHRLHEGKREVRVYDYIDSDTEMLERMYHKRLKGYASLGYHVSADADDTAINVGMIYNQNSFQERFVSDIEQARKGIVIVSPYAVPRRVQWLNDSLTSVRKRGILITVYTRPAKCFQERSRLAAENAIHALNAMDICVRCRGNIHQKYAIIDDRIVWYGSINLLSFGASQESIMRLVSGNVANALHMDE